MEIKQPIASEAGHWYDRTGSSQYTIVGANGKERNTTLRDARKFGYLPSVSAILKVAASPGLEKWKRDNLLMAALTLPKIEGETVDEFAERVEKDANDQATKARDLGTAIHASLENAFGQLGDYPADHEPYVVAVTDSLFNHFGHVSWSAEKSFASALGYGGKIDLHNDKIVIDFKTSAFDDAAKKEGYPEHIMQLVAYGEGLGLKDYRIANVFVSTSTPGLVKIVEYTEEQKRTAWRKFLCLLNYWMFDKGYFPNEVKDGANS